MLTNTKYRGCNFSRGILKWVWEASTWLWKFIQRKQETGLLAYAGLEINGFSCSLMRNISSLFSSIEQEKYRE